MSDNLVDPDVERDLLTKRYENTAGYPDDAKHMAVSSRRAWC
jgi:hypothetical protein